jgi:hypothetical protein
MPGRPHARGFESIDDVDAIVGIPKTVKQTLKPHGSV